MFLQDGSSSLFTKVASQLMSPNSARNGIRGRVFSHRPNSLSREHVTSNLCLLTFCRNTCSGFSPAGLKAVDVSGHLCQPECPGADAGAAITALQVAQPRAAPGLCHHPQLLCLAVHKRYPRQGSSFPPRALYSGQ